MERGRAEARPLPCKLVVASQIVAYPSYRSLSLSSLVYSKRGRSVPYLIGASRCLSVLFHRIAGLTRSAVSVESEDWRLIGCVALRFGLHEGRR